MPLVAFMKQSDPNRISTITPDVSDRSRGRKLVPAHAQEGSDVCDKLIVADCFSHIGGVSVPVELRDWVAGTGWISRGVARCCPLCWKVLVGADGEKEPEVKPLDHSGTHRKRKPRPPKKTTTKAPPVGQPSLGEAINIVALRNWAKPGEWFDTYQVMEQFNVGRALASEKLGMLTRLGLLERVLGAGRGQRTQYRLPEK